MADATHPIPSTMKAWMYHSAGVDFEKKLTLETAARAPPSLRPDQLLVQVLSASINPADFKVPEMGLVSKVIVSTPASPGMDFCGRVVVTGPAVTKVSPGQLVYGTTAKPVPFGSLAEYMAVGEHNIAALPDGVDPDHAATLGVAGLTAYQAVVPYVTNGDKVFINGGSGGCGIFAIQFAKLLGCHVTTTCSGRNADFCRELGADEVIDYTTEDVLAVLKAKGQVFAHVVDHIGTPEALYRECDAFLLPGKAFVQVGASSMLIFVNRVAWPGFLGGGKRKYDILLCRMRPDELAQIGEWVQQGKVKVVVDSTFEFADTVQAFEKLRLGRTRGKIVVHVSEKV
ncbi:NAD(P)-dependent alcohol dehydrogenase [Aspergillus affinis]|uniref:NAD(P)-dependent alcohol dehydrogenase n=1 Tax=Aspergillus affinis TaxID=1070780 RepID=UPI0022FF3A63|nr:putative zinc alcohol dehydrogenase [Aspergillus affinis]KAI9039988.1 putative zinc alcohol dehydrogenase [Aspergillus affinis]